MSTILMHRQPEPSEILVESTPVKKGEKLEIKQNSTNIKWEDVAGLSWIMLDKWDEI